VGFDTTGYMDFSINEIDLMYSKTQLDMILTREPIEKFGAKVYVKYFLDSKQLRPNNLDDIVEDLFIIDTVLEKTDTLIIIVNEEPNDTILAKVKYLYDKDGIFVVIHNIQRLQYNILEHVLVPPLVVLGTEETAELFVKYNLKNAMNLPKISRFDPQALASMVRPGQICKFFRKSATAMTTDYYRVCV
jgi:DNA-directed RNA polymerase subunit H (RpoH/RPB5)